MRSCYLLSWSYLGYSFFSYGNLFNYYEVEEGCTPCYYFASIHELQIQFQSSRLLSLFVARSLDQLKYES